MTTKNGKFQSLKRHVLQISINDRPSKIFILKTP